MKKLNLPVGVSDFSEIRQNAFYYVDKSGLIAELLKEKATKVTLITRPRRFGKTLGMRMLDRFFDIRKHRHALFEAKYTRRMEELNSSCEAALAQIGSRMYAEEFKEDYDQVLCYGISFFKKRCVVRKS